MKWVKIILMTFIATYLEYDFSMQAKYIKIVNFFCVVSLEIWCVFYS